MIEVFVRGVPAPQGSRVSFKTPKGKIGQFESSPRVGAWKVDVAEQVMREMKARKHPGWYKREPLRCEIVFIIPRPRTQSKKIIWPVKRPDLDKLIRAIMDALKHIVYEDDSQVVALCAAKRYPKDGEFPGATILFDLCQQI